MILYVKKKDKRMELQIVLIPLIAFLLSSIINDTIVGTGVVLYCLLGLAAVVVGKIEQNT